MHYNLQDCNAFSYAIRVQLYYENTGFYSLCARKFPVYVPHIGHIFSVTKAALDLLYLDLYSLVGFSYFFSPSLPVLHSVIAPKEDVKFAIKLVYFEIFLDYISRYYSIGNIYIWLVIFKFIHLIFEWVRRVIPLALQKLDF